ncbi:MAG TPA: hypothetical protein VGF21_14045 [Thermoleophilaceae bacterium]
MLPRYRLVVAILALCAVFAPAAHAKVPKDFIGITSEDVFAGSSSYRASNLKTQQSLGVGLIRQTFDWSDIETKRGHYSLGAYDDYVADLADRGIRVLPILYDPPKFQRKSHRGSVCPPRKASAMASFARVLVRRYGPRGSLWKAQPHVHKLPIRSWQVWGEASLPQYWCGKPSAKGYVKLLKSVYKAIKKSDRHAEVVSAGLPNTFLRHSVRLTKFIKQMYRAKAKRYFDTLAINSYARNSRELSRLLRGIRKLMNRYHDRRAKIWITELGWGDKGPKHRFIVGAKGQASRISKSLSYIRKARKRLRLRGFVYFSWRDGAPYAPNFRDLWGLHTGLLTRSGAHKPAYTSFRKAVRRLR